MNRQLERVPGPYSQNADLSRAFVLVPAKANISGH